MTDNFKSVFLVCLDFHDDVNHVLARSPSLEKAQKIAKIAKKKWADYEVYITIEKNPVINPLNKLIDELEEENISFSKRNVIDLCICGAGLGECVGNLKCKCNPLAKCKDVTKNPYNSLRAYQFDNEVLVETIINIINIKRGIIEVVIPEWNPEESFGLSPNEIPFDIRNSLDIGTNLLGKVNLNARSVDEIIIEDIKLQQFEYNSPNSLPAPPSNLSFTMVDDAIDENYSLDTTNDQNYELDCDI